MCMNLHGAVPFLSKHIIGILLAPNFNSSVLSLDKVCREMSPKGSYHRLIMIPENWQIFW
jgi:hypothetical protein